MRLAILVMAGALSVAPCAHAQRTPAPAPLSPEAAQALLDRARKFGSERGTRPIPNKRDFAKLMIEGYPKSALRRGIGGNATVAFCVSEQGRARDPVLVKSSGNADIDAASLKGILTMRFEPGQDKEGRAIDWCDPPYLLTLSWGLPR